MNYLHWILIALGLIVIFIILIYNGLVRKRMYVKEAWGNIDVQLKRKGNVIPNLVDVIKMQTSYEGDLLVKLTSARTGIVDGSPKDRMNASDSVTKMLPNVYAVAENYPTLGVNETFKKLMEEVRDSEDKITYARNRYNVSVSVLNTALEIFPSSIIGSLFNFKKEDFFELDNSERQNADNMRIKDIQ